MKSKLNDLQRLNKCYILIIKKKDKAVELDTAKITVKDWEEERILQSDYSQVSLNYCSTFFFLNKKQNWKPQLYGCGLCKVNKAKFPPVDTQPKIRAWPCIKIDKLYLHTRS